MTTFTHGGLPAIEALHWNSQTYQKLGNIVVGLMSGSSQAVSQAYLDYYNLQRLFLKREFDAKIEELEIYREKMGFAGIRKMLDDARCQIVLTGKVGEVIEDNPEIPLLDNKEVEVLVSDNKQLPGTMVIAESVEQMSLF